MPQAATIQAYRGPFELVKGDAGARLGTGGELPCPRSPGAGRDPGWADGAGDRRASRPHGRTRPGRPTQRLVSAASVDRAGRDRALGAAHPPLRADRGAARVCPAGQTVDRIILAGFVLRLSTRKVGEALLPILGRPISPATVSTVPDRLDRRIDVEPPCHAPALNRLFPDRG